MKNFALHWAAIAINYLTIGSLMLHYTAMFHASSIYKLHVPQYVYAALPTCQKEQVPIIVPGDLIDLKLKLFLGLWPMTSDINKCN